MTTSGDTRLTPVAGFYDALAPDYDLMTGAMKRLNVETAVLSDLVRDFGIAKAIDAGCGTGLHTCILAQLGVEVIGVDVSAEMLVHASARAREMKVNVRFCRSAFAEMDMEGTAVVDGVFCLGNSLTHLLTSSDVTQSLRSFFRALKSEGLLFLQILNYQRILSQKNRVQNVREEGGRLFIRFYDFEHELIRFNILALEKGTGGFLHRLHSVELNPLRAAELDRSLSDTGFREIRMFGNIKRDPFGPDSSSDLFVIARK